MKKLSATKQLDLVVRAREKDQKAQTQLINNYWLDVFSFVMKKVQNEDLADEITVKVFSKVLNKLDLYDPNFQFKTWMLTIAQNTIIDFWRKKARHSEEPTEDLELVKNHSVESPEDLLITEEENEEIQKIVDSMSANYQDIIRLRFFEEKSIKEIAEELNLSVSNTKVRIMRAKRVLAELLRDNNLYHE